MLLKNKVVLVTGSTTGIGKGIAKRCIEQGAQVMIHGRDIERAKALTKELGENCAYTIADFTQDPVKHRVMEDTIERFGRIDVLINNAGISPRNTLDDLDEAFFHRVVNINMKAPLFLSQKAVEQFRKQKTGGNILNIGSINAYTGERVLLVYSMTKGALMTMTRNLGNALASEKIRVNQLNVGWTLTENESKIKQAGGFPNDWEKLVPALYAPNGRILRPDDIAKHAVFWASDFSAPANAVVYELEQYPVVGRNLISEIEFPDYVKNKDEMRF